MIRFGLLPLLTFMWWAAWAAVRAWQRRVYPRVTRGLEISLVFFFRESKNTNRRKLYVINERGGEILILIPVVGVVATFLTFRVFRYTKLRFVYQNTRNVKNVATKNRGVHYLCLGAIVCAHMVNCVPVLTQIHNLLPVVPHTTELCTINRQPWRKMPMKQNCEQCALKLKICTKSN